MKTEKHFGQLPNYVRAIHKGSENNLFVVGRAGTGKTYVIQQILKEENADYEYVNGSITPLSMYQLLYRNRDRIIVFDDTLELMKNDRSISILYQALWESEDNRKKVEWNSTTNRLGETPSEFVFNGQIIFILNEIPEEKVKIRTLLSRCLAIKLNFSYEEMLDLLSDIAEQKKIAGLNKKKRKEVLSYLEKNTINSVKRTNIRTFVKLCRLKKSAPSKWKEMADELHETD